MNFGWQIDADRARAIVHAAIERGVQVFDTSVSYGRGASEAMLGAILHDMGRRKDVVLATKFGSRATPDARDDEVGNGRRAVLRHCELSLARLRTDYIDLLQMHHYDDATPFEETFDALEALVRQGKVLRVGLCNLSGAQLVAAAACAGDRNLAIDTHQVRFNLLDRRAERGVLAEARTLGVANIAYAPLAEGFLSGKYRVGAAFPKESRFALASPANEYERRLTADVATRIARIEGLARERGIAVATLALAWVRGRADIDRILVGPSSVAQVHALEAADATALDADLLRELNEIVPPGTCHV